MCTATQADAAGLCGGLHDKRRNELDERARRCSAHTEPFADDLRSRRIPQCARPMATGRSSAASGALHQNWQACAIHDRSPRRADRGGGAARHSTRLRRGESSEARRATIAAIASPPSPQPPDAPLPTDPNRLRSAALRVSTGSRYRPEPCRRCRRSGRRRAVADGRRCR